MKRKITQRLFWKQWPYKIVLGNKTEEKQTVWQKRFTKHVDDETYAWKSQFRRWFKKTLPDGGLRHETRISVFLKNKDEADLVIETWPNLILELWAPENPQALTLMQDHVHDIIRENPWYKKFPIRARILYSREFKVEGLGIMRDVVSQIDEDKWYAGGLLKTLLSRHDLGKLPHPCGQPFYLYLADNDDAVMLKLQAGEWIDRFERQRKP